MVLCAFMLFFLLSNSGSQADVGLERRSLQWDYLKLSQSWPPGLCMYVRTLHRACELPHDIKSWIIHGLWPTRKGTNEPDNCHDSWKFYAHKIKGIRKRLDQSWPAFDSKPEEIWEHEWKKHGTCATSLAALKDELHYFNQTLTLHSSIDLLRMLKESGIEPSNDKAYEESQVRESVHKAFGGNPVLGCVKDKKSGKMYLWTMYVCLDKSFKPINCPDTAQEPVSDTRLLFRPQLPPDTGSDVGTPTACGRGSIYYQPMP